MALQPDSPSTLSDAILAGGLVSAPAWAASLGEVNAFLTTLSLVVGLLIGVLRLWRICRELRRP